MPHLLQYLPHTAIVGPNWCYQWEEAIPQPPYGRWDPPPLSTPKQFLQGKNKTLNTAPGSSISHSEVTKFSQPRPSSVILQWYTVPCRWLRHFPKAYLSPANPIALCVPLEKSVTHILSNESENFNRSSTAHWGIIDPPHPAYYTTMGDEIR